MANNRPNLRPNMGPGVRPGAQGWIGPQGMSAMGFGVVPQQPGGGMIPAQPQAATTAMMPQPGIPQATTLNTWQQQYIAQQGISLQYFSQRPFQGFHAAFLPQQQQQQQHQQQQWLAVNQKVAEEQRKQHEQYLKQRQFNEQKQRLMSSGGRNKSGVSADSMISNILGGNGGPRPRIPHTQKQGPPHSSDNMDLPQGSKAADWSSMSQMGDLFSHQKGGNSNPESYQAERGVHPSASITSDSSPLPSNHGQTIGAVPGYDVNKTAVRSGTEAAAAATATSSSLALPNWLTGSNLPPVYTATLALVEGVEPGWVDTGRAYMLLMKTGLPPPFLAVLWEMANRTKPGQLNYEEFTVLLALVAAVQGGQAVNNLEALMSCNEPVLPIIDHPALLPLVQDYIQMRQQAQQQQLHQQALEQDLVQEAAAAVQPPVNMQSSATVQPTIPIVQSDTMLASAAAGMVPVSGSQTPIPGIQASAVPRLQQNTVPIVQTHTAAVLPPSAGGSGSKPENDDDEFSDFMSPSGNNQNIAAGTTTTTTATVVDDDDDFADFQSAAPPACQPSQPPTSAPTAGLTLPPPPPPPNISSTNLSPIPLPKSITNLDAPFMSSPSTAASTEVSSLTHTKTKVAPLTNTNNTSLFEPDSFVDNGDRYAAFRDLEEVNPPPSLDVDMSSELPSLGPGSSVDDDPDESFGDFCSSEPTNSLPNSALSSMAFTSSQIVSNDGSIGNSLNQNQDNSNPLSFVSNSVTAASFEATFEADFGVFSSSTSQAPAAPFDNYADIHEAMKKTEAEQKQGSQATWDDPFGEFEEATSSLAVPDIISNSPDGGDDDFGDFVGPASSDTPPDNASLSAFPRLPEGLAETQSVASLELPGLEVTVGLQLSEGRGSGAGPSPDLLEQPRGDINLCLEDKLRDLSFESSTIASVVSPIAEAPLTSVTSGYINTSTASSLPVVDRYSIIRQEDNKESLSEAHTGSWERCLEGAVGLLEEANTTLDSITDDNIKKKVLETTQMVGYIQNLYEVWCVVQRIKSSSQRVPTSTHVDTLLQQANTLWEKIGKNAVQFANEVSSAAENENVMSQTEVCGVCLSGGGCKLMYGGAAYHPPCANLWINCIDLVLPSLTPVTLL